MAHLFPVLRNLVGLGVCLLLPAFAATKANATEQKYWVSERFQESSNVNAGLAEDYSLPIYMPKLFQSSEPKSSDVIICFDNRPLQDSKFVHSDNTRSTKDNITNFCEKHDDFTELGYINHPRKEDSDAVLYGINVEKGSSGKIYCESIFTGHSFFHLLGHDKLYQTRSIEQLKIEPYTVDIFPYGSEQTKRGLLTHLAVGDRVETVSTTSGDVRFWELSVENTWSCLAPAFRLFWREAFELCSTSAQKISSDPNIQRISHNIIEENLEEILNITQTCRSR
ncbi:hypothetical protein IWQ49_006671 [Labrenzia sp. EL_126]|nr:hypothetical protein [Labrenzia sp. EL_126]